MEILIIQRDELLHVLFWRARESRLMRTCILMDRKCALVSALDLITSSVSDICHLIFGFTPKRVLELPQPRLLRNLFIACR